MSRIMFLVLLIVLPYEALGQSICTTPTGATGTCKSLYQCADLLKLVTNKNRTPQDLFTLQNSACGFEGDTPKVCCPEPCRTPDGKTGECINIYQCEPLSSLLRPPATSQNRDLVLNSRCQSEDQYGVCCPLPAQGNCEPRVSAFPPDPRSLCCGLDGNAGNRIIGGTATGVDQYPWLAIIDYLNGGRLSQMCGAVLISGRYVLTAGHCVAGAILNYGTPTFVRLGEYDTGNEGKDCVPVEGGGFDCTNGTTVVRIEKTIPHPEYNPVSPLNRNDIALIRMQELVLYTDFIRPICLPSVDYTSSPPIKFEMFVAGWGAVSTEVLRSKVKQHVKVPFVSAKVCDEVYSKRKKPLWEKQLCAGGEEGKDSCKGDSGGPLMFENGKTFEVTGIVSFGPLPCGLENVPGVYSKVYQYKEWIRTTIKP